MWVRVFNCISVLRRSLGVSDADALRFRPGISFSVKILCSLWYRETFALWIELASVPMWRGAEDGCSGLRWGMVYVTGQSEGSGPRARPRFRVRLLESCRGRVLVRLEWSSFCKIRATVQFNSRITVRQVWHPWLWCRVRPQVCAKVRFM